jgi:hypothetical protein
VHNGTPGGGGGGGWFGGGGGGGCGATNDSGGGGGGGSSFAAAAISGATFSQATAGQTASVTISYVAPTAEASASSLSFSTQPQSTLSAPQTVTVTNTGGGELVVTGLTFTGPDASDFLITSDGCLGSIALGGTCTVGVSFAPQGQGARTATLRLASNDPSTPLSVSLSGTGGQLPTGPTGPTGATGATGPTGATGASGPAGKIELVVCNKVKKSVTTNGHKHTVTVQKCTTKLVSGPVKFTSDRRALSARISRRGVVYATGVAIPRGAGRWQLALTRQTRTLRRGTYTLTLRADRGRGRVVQRRTITIT